MTDLERVREALEWHEYGNQDERRRLAFIELDAHLKEDAERDYRMDFLESMYLETRDAEAEVNRLREENAGRETAHMYCKVDREMAEARYTELLEAVKEYTSKRQESYEYRSTGPTPDLEGHRRLANEASSAYDAMCQLIEEKS